MLKEGLALYGTTEAPGNANNPVIMAWAKEVGVAGWYEGDAVPWCGLEHGVCAHRAGWEISKDLLSAASWVSWGNPINLTGAMLGDTLVFDRPGGHHVGQYIGESKLNFLVYGGNQSNTTGFAWVAKAHLIAVRRAPWKIAQPSNVRKIYLNDSGVIIDASEA
jgi:uncharacterized protein (TIGR02594 family)